MDCIFPETGIEEEAVVSFGKSIIVPSVQELAKNAPIKIPPRYARPELDTSFVMLDESIPVIDFQRLFDDASANSELENLHSASKDWGFFQIVNHGISMDLLAELKSEIEEFFQLPIEDKKKLWQQPDNHEGFGQLFVVSDQQKLDWSDMFYITTLPLNLRRTDLFEKLPPNLRKTLETYSAEVKKLATAILSEMANALKIDVEEMRNLFDDGVQSMRMNYYPPCPEPDSAIGFTPHSDADALTILFQLNQTQGLQIRNNDRWVPVRPLPNALVVNVGDILQIVSNGVYRSVEHRAIVNLTNERLSVATFYSSKLDSELGPAQSLIGPSNPAVYRTVPLEVYFKEFFSRKLNGKSHIDFMRIKIGDQSLSDQS